MNSVDNVQAGCRSYSMSGSIKLPQNHWLDTLSIQMERYRPVMAEESINHYLIMADNGSIEAILSGGRP